MSNEFNFGREKRQYDSICFVKTEPGPSRLRTRDCYSSLVLHRRLTQVDLTGGRWFSALCDAKAVPLDISLLASFVL